MKAMGPSVARLIVTAFVVWFTHFMLCWVAVEVWPGEWRGNQLAWVFTGIALLAMGVHVLRVSRTFVQGEVDEFGHRIARGAMAIAVVGIVFTALPSVVFLP